MSIAENRKHLARLRRKRAQYNMCKGAKYQLVKSLLPPSNVIAGCAVILVRQRVNPFKKLNRSSSMSISTGLIIGGIILMLVLLKC